MSRDRSGPRESSEWSFIFRALRHRNFRLFFIGQSISLIGTWMQIVAMGWLVFDLTKSALMLGVIGFCGQFPSLIIPPLAGVVADRWNRHRLLIVTQTLAMTQAFIVAGLVLTHVVKVWHLFPLSIFLGCVNAFDLPARQSLYVDMIEDRNDLSNAIALNSSMVNGARLIGPTIAGLLIASLGEGMCFLLNAISYLAVLAALLLMHPIARKRTGRVLGLWEGIREGYAYVAGFAPVRALLLLIALVSLMGMPYSVLMPIFATRILGGKALTLGFLMASSGLGALGGAVFLASRKTVLGLGRAIAVAAFLFGFGLVVFALSRFLLLSMAALVVTGFGMILVLAASNTILQTLVDDDKRGRVMAYFTMAFMGMVPFGSLLAGVLGDRIGAPRTVLVGGVCCIAGALVFAGKLPALRQLARPVYVSKGIIVEE